MKKVVWCLAILLVGLVAWYYLKPTALGFGENSSLVDSVTHTSFSTSTTLPVKLVSANYNRLALEIDNNSTGTIYIYEGTFASATAASTTVLINTGIAIPTMTQKVYNPANMYIGQVWVAATTPAYNVLVTEK